MRGASTPPTGRAGAVPARGAAVRPLLVMDVSSHKLGPARLGASARLFGLATLLLAGSVAAHQAPSGWAYDAACCSGRDCALVGPGVVREVSGGYAVVVLPGTHPMVPRGAAAVRAFVGHGDRRIRASGDEHRHVCIAGRAVLCLYVPPGGV